MSGNIGPVDINVGIVKASKSGRCHHHLSYEGGLVPDMGGPRVYGAAELLRGYLRASKRRRRPTVPVPLPGKAARAFRDGANLAPERAVGQRTWEEFLEERVLKDRG